MTPEKCFIYTKSGVKFFPVIPDIELIKIEDIAHALGNICRFTGHTRSFYSVAQHSILVSLNVPKKLALAGLLHDASEAYLCDVSSPVKKLDSMRTYREVEAQLQALIYEKFGVPFTEPPKEIHLADQKVFRSEVDAFMPAGFQLEGARAKQPIEVALPPEQAGLAFLERYATIVGKKGA